MCSNDVRLLFSDNDRCDSTMMLCERAEVDFRFAKYVVPRKSIKNAMSYLENMFKKISYLDSGRPPLPKVF